MKDKKKTIRIFSMFDAEGIEQYLQEEASKGWMLEKVTGLFWYFTKQEPTKLCFSVVYMDKASEFDAEPREEQLIFQDFCEHAGWKYVAGIAQMQIFCNASPDPIPIETDDEIQLKRMRKSMRMGFFVTWIQILFGGIVYLLLVFFRYLFFPLETLANPFALLTALCSLFLLGLAVSQLAGYQHWYKQAMKKISLGEKITKRWRSYRLEYMVLIAELAEVFCIAIALGGKGIWPIAMGLVGGVLAVTGIVMGAITAMKKRRFSARKNASVTIVLVLVLSAALGAISILSFERILDAGRRTTEDTLLLSLENLGVNASDGSICEVEAKQESVFLGYYKAEQRAPFGKFGPMLEYTVVTVKCPCLYQLAEKKMKEALADRYAHPTDPKEEWKKAVIEEPTAWGADRAYRLEVMGMLQVCYLLCYENRIVKVEINGADDFTEAQKQIVKEKLGGQ